MQIERIAPRFTPTLQDVQAAIRANLKVYSDGSRTVFCREKPSKGRWIQLSVPVETDSPEAA